MNVDLIALTRYIVANQETANIAHAETIAKTLQLKLVAWGDQSYFPDLEFPSTYDPESDLIPDHLTVIEWCQYMIECFTEMDLCEFKSWTFERLYWILHSATKKLVQEIK